MSLRRLLRSFSTESRTAAVTRKAISLGAPASIRLFPDYVPWLDAGDDSDKRSTVRQIGCTRHALLRKEYFTTDEIEGLAYRIKALTKNDGINSVIISRSQEAGIFLSRDDPYLYCEHADPQLDPAPLFTTYSAYHADETTFKHLEALVQAVRGSTPNTKVPAIFIVPALEDGGAAMLWSSYVLANYQSSLQLTNPTRGLALDSGLSYLLPRLGQEFQQPSAEFPCGMLLALGYLADDRDLVEVGLATHYVDAYDISVLEEALMEVPPWSQQVLLKEPIRHMGEQPENIDHNGLFRNVSVAEAINSFSEYGADGTDMWTFVDDDAELDDTSLEPDYVPWHQYRTSDLVDMAATFADVLKERTVVGILEGFKQVAAGTSKDPEEQVCIKVATEMVEQIERSSPLALSVAHRLLALGAESRETPESCLQREIRAQTNLLQHADFKAYKKHSRQHDTHFTKWKHKTLADVTSDEVTELIES